MAAGRRVVLVGFLVLVTLAGCARLGSRPTPAGAAAAAETSEEVAPGFSREDPSVRPMRVPELEWSAGGAADLEVMDRFALVVAVDTYADATWSLPAAGANAELMAEVLEETCDVPPSEVERLTGADVSPESVREAVLTFGRSARSERSALVVYLTGYAALGDDGQPQYFTHATLDGTRGAYQATFTRQDMAQWASLAVAEAGLAGSQLEVVFVTDVFRPEWEMTATPEPLAPIGLWEVHGSRPGRFSTAPVEAEPSTFTAVLAETLGVFADQGMQAGPADALTTAGNRVEVMTGGAQEPQLVRGDGTEGLTLVSERRAGWSVAAHDAESGRAVEGAWISLDMQDAVELGEGLLFPARRGRRLLRVGAPGYLTRTEEVEILTDHAGREVDVPLMPALVYVRGRVSPPASVELRLVGDTEGARPSVHRLRRYSSDDGHFSLAAPALRPGLRLEVNVGETSVASVELPELPDRYLRGERGVLEGVPVVDVGTVLLPVEEPLARLQALVGRTDLDEDVGDLPLPERYVDRGLLPGPGELATQAEREWQIVLNLVDRGQYARAREHLLGLADSIDGYALEGWRGWLEVRIAQEEDDDATLAEHHAGVPPELPDLRVALASILASRRLERAAQLSRRGAPGAVDELRSVSESMVAGADDYARSVLEAARQQKIVVAAHLLSRQVAEERWKEALRSLERLTDDPTWESEAWTRLRDEVGVVALSARLADGLAAGRETGDWSESDWTRRWMERNPGAGWFRKAPQLAHLAADIMAEHIDLESRRTYELAQSDFEAHRYAEAYDRYTALRGKVTDHYGSLVDAQCDYLGELLFLRYAKEGLAHEIEGERQAASASYARALRYDARAADYLVHLGVPSPEVPVVAPDGRGGHTSIMSAVSTAPAGAVVLVKPGVYREHLELSSEVTLVGMSSRTGVTIESPDGRALSLLPGADVRISGMHFASQKSNGPLVDVRSGSAHFELCTFAPPEDEAAVAVSGKQGLVVMTGCEMPDAPGDAFSVTDGAQLSLRSCRIAQAEHEPLTLHRFFVTEEPGRIWVQDCELGDLSVGRGVDIDRSFVARLHRSNVVRVDWDTSRWPEWAIDGETHFHGLADAIAAAEPGATVEVAPGNYVDSLRLERPLRLMARGPLGSVVVGSDQHALLIDDDIEVSVKGIVFRIESTPRALNAEAVAVRRGHLELTDCRIESVSSTGDAYPDAVAVGPSRVWELSREDFPDVTASVVLKRCTVESDATAIAVHGSSVVQVWDSEISGQVAGLLPRHGGSIDVFDSIIRDCERAVHIGGTAALATLEGCQLTNNLDQVAYFDGAVEGQVTLRSMQTP